MSAGAIAHAAARSTVARGADLRHLRSRGVDPDAREASRVALDEFLRLPLLLHPALREHSLRALTAARGGALGGRSPFPSTLWPGGATDVTGGRDPGWTLRDFVQVLEVRAGCVAPKRRGWVVEPTTCPSGRRTNDATLAVHALFLDCDGRGEWSPLLRELDALDYGYVAYQSGGWSPSTPKWRLVLPLASTFPTVDAAARAIWRAVYLDARIAFGSVGGLLGEGFDPATDGPSNPWFLTERRDPSASLREVRWRPGHALDLARFALALPPADESPEEARTPAPVGPRPPLPDERLQEIVTALAPVTSVVPSGRRPLYLALAGVLLDRGLDSDDVLEVVETVSASYPGGSARAHADNLHCARTTIKKWEAGDAVTRIGTLVEHWPRVAEALDVVLPPRDLVAYHLLAARCAGGAPPDHPPADPTREPAIPDWPAPADLRSVRRAVAATRARKRHQWEASRSPKDALHYEVLSRVLDRRALADPPARDAVTALSAEESVRRLAAVLAWALPRNTPLDAIAELARPALGKMLAEGDAPDRWLTPLRQEYVRSLAERLKADAAWEAAQRERADFARAYALRGEVL